MILECIIICQSFENLVIKNCEKNKRNDNRHVACQLTGADQKRSSKWLQSLGVDKFKEALVEFVITF